MKPRLPKINKKPFLGSFLAFQLVLFWSCLFFLFVMSFETYSGGVVSKKFSVENYIGLFKNQVFIKAAAETVSVAITAAVICTVIAFAYVIVVFESKSRRIRLIAIFLVASVVASGGIARLYSLGFLLSNQGPFWWLWQFLPYAQGAPLFTEFGILVGYAALYVPFSAIILFVSRLSVPRSYLDAAADLGAPKLTILRHIILPAMRPGIVISLLLPFLMAVADVLVVDLIGGSAVYSMSSIVLDHVKVNDWGLASATGVLILTGFLVLLLLFGRLIKPAYHDIG